MSAAHRVGAGGAASGRTLYSPIARLRLGSGAQRRPRRWLGLGITLGAVGLGVIGVVAGSAAAEITLAALVILMLLCGLYRTLFTGQLVATRSVEPTLVEWGTPVEHRLQFVNPRRLAATVTVVDDATMPGHPRGGVITVRGRGPAHWHPPCQASQRGVWRVGPTWVQVQDPFGLFIRTDLVASAVRIVVKPRHVALQRCALFIDGLQPGTLRGRRKSQQPPAFAGTQPYQPGDGLAAIHWPASARSLVAGGPLIRKQFDPAVEAAFWLALDLDPAPERAVTGGGPHRTESTQLPVSGAAAELMATVAASLTHYLVTYQLDVGLVMSGRAPMTLRPAHTERQRDAIELALAEAGVSVLRGRPTALDGPEDGLSSPTPAGPSATLEGQLRAARAQMHPGHTLVLLTSQPPQVWLRVLQRWRRQGLHIQTIAIGAGGRSWLRPDLWLPETYADPGAATALTAALEGRIG